MCVWTFIDRSICRYQTVSQGGTSGDAINLAGADEVALLSSPVAYTPGATTTVTLPNGSQRLFAYVIGANGAAASRNLGVVEVEDAPSSAQQLADRQAELDAALDASEWNRATQLVNVLVQDDSSADGCLRVAESLDQSYRPPASGFTARQQAQWVQRQSDSCESSAELRDAHLSILSRVGAASGDGYVPLQTGSSVDGAVAAATGATVSSAIGSAVSVAGQTSKASSSSPASAKAVRFWCLCRLLCDLV